MVTWKNEKEAFVSGHSGGSAIEVIILAAVIPPISSLLCRLVCRRSASVSWLCCRRRSSSVLRFLMEQLTVVFPSLVCFTVLSSHVLASTVTVALICASAVLASTSTKVTPTSTKATPKTTSSAFTELRAAISTMTAIAILAVDFPIFPRRFAKTEIRGFSLMDTGVAMFILSSGVGLGLSRSSKLSHQSVTSSSTSTVTSTAPSSSSPSPSPSSSSSSSITSVEHRNRWREITGAVPWRRIAILAGIGACRVVFVKVAGYPEHIGEYGVHWNFFFTLASVSLVQSIISAAVTVTPRRAAYLAAGAALVHHVALSMGLGDWVLSRDPRPAIPAWVPVPWFVARAVEMNREGMLSVPGYVCLSLVGQFVGGAVLRRQVGEKGSSLGAFLAGVAVSLPLLVVLCVWVGLTGELPCRVLVDVPYLLFSSFVFVLHVTLHALVDVIVPGTQPSVIATGMSNNLLPFFLVANVATGFVNMSVNTSVVPSRASFAVLFVYTFVLSLFANELGRRGIRTKL